MKYIAIIHKDADSAYGVTPSSPIKRGRHCFRRSVSLRYPLALRFRRGRLISKPMVEVLNKLFILNQPAHGFQIRISFQLFKGRQATRTGALS